MCAEAWARGLGTVPGAPAVPIIVQAEEMGLVGEQQGGEKEKQERDFPGGPVAKSLRSPCRGPGFDPWSGN